MEKIDAYFSKFSSLQVEGLVLNGNLPIKYSVLAVLNYIYCNTQRYTVSLNDGGIRLEGTGKGKCRRTLRELFLILRPVYPNLKVTELHQSLGELLREKVILSWICENIHKRIYSVEKQEKGLRGENIDEFGLSFEESLGIYKGKNYGADYTHEKLKQYEDY